MHDAVIVNRGFQALNTVHFNHQIKCVAQRAAEAVAVHYTIGSGHVTSVLPFLPHEAQSKHSVDGDISQLIYIKKYRLYVAFCLDLTLRVFSEHFDPIQTVHVTATVLSFAFNESTSELYCGGVGCFEVWQLQHQLHSPLIHGKAISCSVGQHQWVVSLYHDVCVEKLVIACQDAIYIIDVQSHKQIDVFSNGHKSSITSLRGEWSGDEASYFPAHPCSAVLYPQKDYLISAAKDGSIKIWNSILHTEVHTFSGHLKAVTGLRPHPLSQCVISCSLDGTMRMWSLESMIESYRLDCGEELLGFSCDFPTGVRMACFSHQNVKMWIVNKVEAHFATVNSHVVSMSRVEGTGSLSSTQPARILALAEDGGVRLLSPVTGQVVSILFPMFSSQILHEVAYSLSEGLLFALLRTSEVLVFSTLTNPCTASQLWASPTSQDRVTCIALCSIVAQCDRQKSLVFGGQECGHISLLHGSGLSMPHPCPAHAGHVIKLTSPTHPIDPNSPNPALVSYGSDNMLNIWSLELKKGNQNVNAVLKIHMSVNLEPCPIHIALLHSTLCLALADNRIIQLNIPPVSRYESQSFGSLPLLTHQSEDDHTDTITSLSSCTHLKLFATSSGDGHIKVWSADNHLVSEIQFGASLASAGFANPRGDLLVGFQKHICIVEAEHYLPAVYTDAGTEYPYSDSEEEPIPFDPDLEFWYDPARVPSLPVQQGKRKLLLTQTCDPSCDVLQEKERHPIESGATSVDCAASKSSLQFCHAQMVDRSLARELSSQYFASLEPEHRRRGKSKLKLPSQESLTVKEDYSGVIVGDWSSSQLQYNLDDCKHSFLASISELPGDSQSATSSSNSFMDCQNKMPPAAAEVLPLESASSKFPIAPDGLIPNSIIRAQIGYVPPEVSIPPCRPKLKAKQPPSAVQEISYPLAKPHEHLSGESLQRRRSSAWTEKDGEVITCVSEFLEPGSPVKKMMAARSSNRQKSPSGTSSSGRASSYRSEGIEMDAAATIQGPSVHIHGPSEQHSVDVSGTKPKVVTRFDPPLEEQVQSRKTSRQSHEDRRLSSSDTSKPFAPSPRRRSSTRESQLPGRLSRNHSMCGDRATSPVMVQRSQSNSYSVNASTVRMSNTTSSASLEKRMELSAVEKLLQRITSQPWYPIHRKGSTGSAPAVVDTLVSMLKRTQMPIFHKVGSALLELEEASLMTDDQRQSAVHQTLARLKSKAKSMKAAVLKILEWLGIGGREVILAILPLLTDSELELRDAAFGTLKRLAGIVNRAQLHRLLIEYGLLQNVVTNEDEILGALSARIRAGQVKVPAMWYNQESGQRSRDELKFKPLYDRETAALGISTALSVAHNPKPDIDMQDLTQAVSEKPEHPTSDTDVEQLSSRYIYQNPATSTAKLPKACMQVGERTTPPVGSFAQPQSNRDYYNRDRVNLSFPQHYSDSQQHSGPATTTFKADSSACSKLHQLMAHNPTAFSQTKPAINMMMGAYTKNKTAVSTESDDYTWSEVFPVIKAVRKLSTHTRSASLPNDVFLPRLDVLTPTCPGEGRTNIRVQDTDMVVKLPKITVSRVT